MKTPTKETRVQTRGDLPANKQAFALMLYQKELIGCEFIAKLIGCGQKKLLAFIKTQCPTRTEDEARAAIRMRTIKTFKQLKEKYPNV